MCKPRNLASRGAMTLIELIAAASILAVLLGSAVQVIRVLDKHRQSTERRAIALQTTQALLEELSNTPWEQLTPAAAAKLQIPEAVTDYLPTARIVATVDDETDPVAAKRVAVAIEWTAAGNLNATQLTTWVYAEPTLQ
jgi:prepilin-type N-terminal cleavage/methylation domain-containing protein